MLKNFLRKTAFMLASFSASISFVGILIQIDA